MGLKDPILQLVVLRDVLGHEPAADPRPSGTTTSIDSIAINALWRECGTRRCEQPSQHDLRVVFNGGFLGHALCEAVECGPSCAALSVLDPSQGPFGHSGPGGQRRLTEASVIPQAP
jgi:hypothetical protein